MLLHLLRLIVLISLLLAAMFLPFLPGRYDALAVTLSFMAQLVGFAGLLLVPLGALWLVAELRRRAAGAAPSTNDSGFYFALAALVAASLVAAVVALPAFANLGLSFGLMVLALWLGVLVRLVPRLKPMRSAAPRGLNPAPLYLVCVPLAVLAARVAFIGPATEFSRNRAMDQSARLIRDLEAYHAANGRYPASLAAVWHDYEPGIMGISRYYYEPSGRAYNLFFEQFSPDLAAREFVVYSPLGEQEMTSHDGWILLLSPDELDRSRGYFAARAAARPHWKSFWFD